MLTKEKLIDLKPDASMCNSWWWWELRSTEEAFLLPTQQPRVRIPAPPRFFSLYCLVCEQFVDRTQWISKMQLAVTYLKDMGNFDTIPDMIIQAGIVSL